MEDRQDEHNSDVRGVYVEQIRQHENMRNNRLYSHHYSGLMINPKGKKTVYAAGVG